MMEGAGDGFTGKILRSGMQIMDMAYGVGEGGFRCAASADINGFSTV